MTRVEATEMIARVMDAWHRRDIEALSGFHADDGVVETPLGGGTTRGREAISKVYEAFFRAFPDVKLEYEEPLVDGDRIVLIARISGTDSGGFMGMHPTGRVVNFPCVLLFDFKNGLIARERRIYDFTGLAVQVGAIKAKPV
jgi:steroid delta-isomerase-like uncharacterized protein